MKDRFNDELISAYLDDELSPEERALVQRQLENSPQHRQMLEELQALQESLQALPQFELPRDLSQSVLRRAERWLLLEESTAAASGPEVGAAQADPAGEVSGDDSSRVTLGKDAAPEDRSSDAWRGALWAVTAVVAAVLLMAFLPRPAQQPVAVRDHDEEVARRMLPDARIGAPGQLDLDADRLAGDPQKNNAKKQPALNKLARRELDPRGAAGPREPRHIPGRDEATTRDNKSSGDKASGDKASDDKLADQQTGAAKPQPAQLAGKRGQKTAGQQAAPAGAAPDDRAVLKRLGVKDPTSSFVSAVNGGERQFVVHLDVTPEELSRWMSGRRLADHGIVFARPQDEPEGVAGEKQQDKRRLALARLAENRRAARLRKSTTDDEPAHMRRRATADGAAVKDAAVEDDAADGAKQNQSAPPDQAEESILVEAPADHVVRLLAGYAAPSASDARLKSDQTSAKDDAPADDEPERPSYSRAKVRQLAVARYRDEADRGRFGGQRMKAAQGGLASGGSQPADQPKVAASRRAPTAGAKPQTAKPPAAVRPSRSFAPQPKSAELQDAPAAEKPAEPATKNAETKADPAAEAAPSGARSKTPMNNKKKSADKPELTPAADAEKLDTARRSNGAERADSALRNFPGRAWRLDKQDAKGVGGLKRDSEQRPTATPTLPGARRSGAGKGSAAEKAEDRKRSSAQSEGKSPRAPLADRDAPGESKNEGPETADAAKPKTAADRSASPTVRVLFILRARK